jgi:hypothetical protein
MATSPTLEAFEAELKKYMAVETEIAAIPTLYNIGECLCQLPSLSHACCIRPLWPTRAIHEPRLL